MKRMVTRKVIVRKLDALEALGGVTNICSDKTGTLTQGKMVTRKAWIPGIGIYSVDRTEEATDPTSGMVRLSPVLDAQPDPEQVYRQAEDQYDQLRSALAFADDPRPSRHLELPTNISGEPEEEYTIPEVVDGLAAFLHSSALCNLATIRFDEQKGKWQATGDPTEVNTTYISFSLILNARRLPSKYLPVVSTMGKRSSSQMDGANLENIPSTAILRECLSCFKNPTLENISFSPREPWNG